MSILPADGIREARLVRKFPSDKFPTLYQAAPGAPRARAIDGELVTAAFFFSAPDPEQATGVFCFALGALGMDDAKDVAGVFSRVQIWPDYVPEEESTVRTPTRESVLVELGDSARQILLRLCYLASVRQRNLRFAGLPPEAEQFVYERPIALAAGAGIKQRRLRQIIAGELRSVVRRGRREINGRFMRGYILKPWLPDAFEALKKAGIKEGAAIIFAIGNPAKSLAMAQSAKAHGWTPKQLHEALTDPDQEGGSIAAPIAKDQLNHQFFNPQRLGAAWVFFLKRTRNRAKADDPDDAQAICDELMRVHGFTEAELLAEIEEPDRDKTEYLFRFKNRLVERRQSQPASTNAFVEREDNDPGRFW